MSIFDMFKKENAETAPQVDISTKINLAKEEVHKICLTKKLLNGLVARVGLVLDYSGSMDVLYEDGTVQSVIEKILPLAMEFDDNGTMECWIFENGYHRLPDITLSNVQNYIRKNVLKYKMGGTKYAPVMKNVIKTYHNSKHPAYVLFITDGNNSDREDTTATICDASKLPIFWQFVGIGSATFTYLQELDDINGRYVDNADFFKVSEAKNITYNDILNEFPTWLENEKVKAMI